MDFPSKRGIAIPATGRKILIRQKGNRGMYINQNQYGRSYQGGQRVGYSQGYNNKNDNSVGGAQGRGEKNDNSVKEEQENGTKDEEIKSYREQILEKMEEMAKNIKQGTIQPKFKIGAEAYTIGEWEKLLEKFDAAEDVLREEVKAQIEEIKKQAAMEAMNREMAAGMAASSRVTTVSVSAETDSEGVVIAPATVETVWAANVPSAVETDGSTEAGTAGTDSVTGNAAGAEDVTETITEEDLSLLTEEVTKCSYPSEDPKEKHWYVTCYTQDGISCKEGYFDGTKWVTKDLWSFSYTEKGQYEKVMAFLERFAQDANLRFAAHENFWKDFLAGKIDEDDFVAFFETTKDGVPDYTYEKDGSTYIDREKVKYAKYMNDFGASFYTEEEMMLILEGILHENSKNLNRLSDSDGVMTIPGSGSGETEQPEDSKEDDLKTQIVTKPDGSTVLEITTSYGVMAVEITQAQKFGLMLDVGRNAKESAGYPDAGSNAFNMHHMSNRL